MMPFEKGASGNKQGRIAGQTPGAKLRKAIEAKADDILQSVINAAIRGLVEEPPKVFVLS
jgi:hypothetical protein